MTMIKTGPGENDGEIPEPKKIPYPKSVFFIVVTEFCERFAYYGMRAVLTIYMRNVLNFSEDLSTTVYHIFLFLCYFLPIFGAILSDSFIGKFYTVYILSSIFAVGNIILTAAATPPLQLPTVSFSLLGLLLMAVGTGGIKPCVVALGGDQFKLPEQESQLKKFFSVFLFAVSVGNMASTVLTPVLRSDVSCFNNDCYPLAFGVPTFLMITAIVIFISGKSLYIINRPTENIILRVFQCMKHAISQKRKHTEKEKQRKSITNDISSTPDKLEKKHWVDYAHYDGSKFDKKLIEDTKGLLRVLVYYLPIPVFWSLYEQLGSRWTLQATKMDGTIGNYRIKPDQMQVTNAILMFIFIPVFETVLYPLLRKCNLFKRPLQRMTVGGLLAAVSFFLAYYTEIRIEKNTLEVPSSGETYLNIINTLSCPMSVRIEGRGFLENEFPHTGAPGEVGKEQFDIVLPQSNFILRSITERNVTLSMAVTLSDSPTCFLLVPPHPQLNQSSVPSKLSFNHVHSNRSQLEKQWEKQKQAEFGRPKQATLYWTSQVPITTLPGKVQSIIISPGFLTSTGTISTAGQQSGSNRMIQIRNLQQPESNDKSKEGNSKLTVYNLADIKSTSSASLVSSWRRIKLLSTTSKTVYKSGNLSSSELSWKVEVVPDSYKVYLETPDFEKGDTESSNWHWQELKSPGTMKLQPGGNYILVLQDQKNSKIKPQLVTLVPPNEVHILFLLPQYIIMAWAEILFIISGMEFSFTEAPISMKSVLQSCWHLTNAVGNLMVIIAAQIKGNHSQSLEFLAFALLMAADTVIFALMAMRYKYVTPVSADEDDSIEPSKKKNNVGDNNDNVRQNSIHLPSSAMEKKSNGTLDDVCNPENGHTSEETRL